MISGISYYCKLEISFNVPFQMSLILFQVGYVLGICGCIILFGIILNALLERESDNKDVSLFSFIFWPSLALLLALVYILLWFIVFKSWKKIRRRMKHNQVFTCMEWKMFVDSAVVQKSIFIIQVVNMTIYTMNDCTMKSIFIVLIMKLGTFWRLNIKNNSMI